MAKKKKDKVKKLTDEEYSKYIMAMAGGDAVADEFRMECIPVEKNGKSYKYCYSLVESSKFTPVMYHDIVAWGTKAMKENCKKRVAYLKERMV